MRSERGNRHQHRRGNKGVSGSAQTPTGATTTTDAPTSPLWVRVPSARRQPAGAFTRCHLHPPRPPVLHLFVIVRQPLAYNKHKQQQQPSMLLATTTTSPFCFLHLPPLHLARPPRPSVRPAPYKVRPCRIWRGDS